MRSARAYTDGTHRRRWKRKIDYNRFSDETRGETSNVLRMRETACKIIGIRKARRRSQTTRIAATRREEGRKLRDESFVSRAQVGGDTCSPPPPPSLFASSRGREKPRKMPLKIFDFRQKAGELSRF